MDPSRVALPVIGEQAGEAQIPIPLTRSPNGGFVALQLGSEEFSPLACGDSQNNSGSLHLIPGRHLTAGNSFQFWNVERADGNSLGLATTHTDTSHAEAGHLIIVAGRRNSVQVLVPPTLGSYWL